jgi:hypothetical protein
MNQAAVQSYQAGRLVSRPFRSVLDSMKMRNLVEYTETKGMVVIMFHVRASQQVHDSITGWIRSQ